MLFGAHAYLSTSRVALAAPPVLQELATSTGLTASVFVRVGFSRAVVARVEGSRPMRYELPIGERLPLHLGAGKVLAAFMEPSELDALVGSSGPAMRADGTELTPQSLTEELQQIRRQGYAISRNERVVGAASVSAPVIAPHNGCVAAVQVAGQSHDVEQHSLEALTVEVRQAAGALLTRLATT
jgi:IclR family acetate operon transcriptional repressor